MMFALRRIVILTFLATANGAFAASAGDIFVSHYEPLERLSIQNSDGQASQKPGAFGPVSISFDTLGRNFDLQLEPNARLLAAIPLQQRSTDAVPYRGRLAGVADSWARIVMVRGMPAGLVWDGDSLYAFEVPGDSLVDTAVPIAYRLADVIIPPGAMSCATGSVATNGATAYESLVSGLKNVVSQAAGAISEINIGAIADFEATSAKADIDSAVLTRFSNVDGIYSQQIGVQVNAVMESFADANDPFGDSLVAGELIDDVETYRSSTPNQQALGLTHLYTGRDLEGTTAGIAYVGVLCHPNVGVGLSMITDSAAIDSLVAAHEIGHNFGAVHDGEVGEACESAPLNHIMAPSVNGNNNTFSACSVAIMEASAAGASCVTALPSTDISISFNEPDSTVLLSNAASVTLNVVNNGTQVATNVAAAVSLPGTFVSYVDASGGSAVCTEGTGTVDCQIGDVAGGSSMTIAITTDTVSVGAGSFDATVVADADDRPGNNQDSVQLTVDPAVNLVINALASAEVEQDQSTTVTAVLDNLSSLDATGVTLRVSLNAGLQANSATWSIGTCSVAAQLVDCQASQFDNQSSSTLSISVTGVVTGSKRYTVELASNEADANPADNSVEGTVRVRAPDKDDEGGGSFGWFFLLLLAMISAQVWLCRPGPVIPQRSG